MFIRPAVMQDAQPIADIYNEAVLHSTATFDTVPRTLEQQRDWLRHHTGRSPALVAEADGKVVGWASLSPWSDRPAYDCSAEGSVYVHKDYRRLGLGRELSTAILDAGRKAGVHTVIGRICSENTASLEMVKGLGFRHVGTLREVGVKFGRRLDVDIVQIILD